MLNDLNPPNRYFRRLSRRLPALALIICLAGAGLLIGTFMKDSRPEQHTESDSPGAKADPSDRTIKGSIKPGDTISSLFGDLFSSKEIHELTRQCREVYPLARISLGQPYTLSLNGDEFKRFAYDIDSDEKLIIGRNEHGFSVSREPIRYMIEQAALRGTIESSLFRAVVDIGESEGLALQLSDIFAWDIDFFNDIRVGDSFEAVVEKRYRKGQPAGNGRLLAASFTVQGQTYQAFYFQDGNRPPGYYDRNGQSLRKAFLKAPLSFSRISSGFNMRRLHPITNRIKEHPAIDYAAPSGTPIQSVGDGTVTFAAYKGDNGKCVKIRHPNGWITMYNHLSRFGKNIQAGKKVQQGQIIGYVGNTGLSTGPHLDFRMYRDGKPVNPLKVKSPPAMPVSPANLADFKAMVADRLALMENQSPRLTAKATPTHLRRQNWTSEASIRVPGEKISHSGGEPRVDSRLARASQLQNEKLSGTRRKRIHLLVSMV
jgi:murein DD-endopeptidase MepM/ murein hydrolase activator NlpD